MRAPKRRCARSRRRGATSRAAPQRSQIAGSPRGLPPPPSPAKMSRALAIATAAAALAAIAAAEDIAYVRASSQTPSTSKDEEAAESASNRLVRPAHTGAARARAGPGQAAPRRKRRRGSRSNAPRAGASRRGVAPAGLRVRARPAPPAHQGCGPREGRHRAWRQAAGLPRRPSLAPASLTPPRRRALPPHPVLVTPLLSSQRQR